MIYRAFLLSVIAAFSMGSLAACDNDDGPLEKAGESMDEAAEEVADEIDDNT